MANDKLQQTSSASTNVTDKAALVTDLNASYIGNSQYSYARNAVRNSKEGDLGTIGNEPSNLRCIKAPYDIVGTIPLPDNTILVMSGNGTHSEIGLGNDTDCTYSKLLSLDCLGFTTKYPITGVAKKDFQKGTIITFTDKNTPVKRIELNKISAITSCDDILLFKKIDRPCILTTKGQVGNIPNGTYSIAVAYVVDNQIFSDWYSITNRVQLHSETSSNSIDVRVTNIDKEFKQFAVAVIGNYIDPTTKGATKAAKIVGTFSTKVSTLSITDFLNSTYEDIPLSSLVIQKKTWQKAGIVAANSNYLFLADLVSRPEENYQLKAMSITTQYVVDQVPADYYINDGEDVGFYRDENYDFYISGIYNTGELTDKFYCPGPRPTAAHLTPVSSADVYEHDSQFKDCSPQIKVPKWQVENTAGRMIPQNNDFVCNRRTLGSGDMGVFLSTDLLPDNVDMFGEDANTRIRYHKMPDECKVPRYSIIDGKEYINIIGIRFKNIPAFDNPDIVGYQITRSDRKGGNGTVVARGMLTNVRSYFDEPLDREIYYANYTVNDLAPDQYISSTQTVYKNGKETNFNPLTTYHLDKFNFHSPHTSYEPRYSLGTEVKIECEEIAEVSGKFEVVFNHPKEKLLNQFSFWVAAAVGFLESTLVLLGGTDLTAVNTSKLTLVDSGTISEIQNHLKIESINDLISLSPVQLIGLTITAVKALDVSNAATIINLIKAILQTITGLGLKIPYSILSGIKQADDTLQTIYNFTGYTDYVYQYNAHATFNQTKCVENGNKRRRVIHPATYIPSTIVTINDKTFNNLFREKSVYLEVNKPITKPTTKDTSRNVVSGFHKCDNPLEKVTSVGSAFYATSKVINPNQYGELGSSNPVSMHSCPLVGTVSPVLYGGDCIIVRDQYMKTMQFFSQNIANTNFQPGTEYDYRKYRNLGYARFWIDTTKYDFSELLSSNIINFAKFSRTTSSKHNLDCKSNDKKSISRIDDAYMYLSNNCVIDYFVEADYNPNFREKTQRPFFSQDNTNLSDIFRSDRLETPEEFVINRVYTDIYTTEISAQQQRDDFDPLNPIPVNQENSVIYSLPSFNLQEVDNWQYFLPANYFAFRESDFGTLTSINKLDQDRLLFTFSKSSPFVSLGKDVLQLEQSGRKITVGDDGLFAQDPREVLPTDNNYGACTSRYAFSNTHLGRFYPSSPQGRVLDFQEGLTDITRQGMSYWCKNYMPIFLYQYFPTYPKIENPLSGVGYLTVFDSFYETVYIIKRDFSPNRDLAKDIIWDTASSTFRYKGNIISLKDTAYFNDVSWTLSYSPLDKAFVSWHDWHPDWVVQRDNHFLTVKADTLWKHNERFDSFCNFYDTDHPFELEVLSSSGQQIEVIRNIEYLLEVYKYKNNGRNRFHVLNQNFDRLQVSNTEQMSPLLNLYKSSQNPEDRNLYPKKSTINNISYDILFDKEENKYRINQFWDSVKDRGEFDNADFHLFVTDESGYKTTINTLAIDIDKPEEERKKFRHYWNRFRFSKTVCGENKMLFKIVNIKKLNSPR